jgi:hypothetical protein
MMSPGQTRSTLLCEPPYLSYAVRVFLCLWPCLYHVVGYTLSSLSLLSLERERRELFPGAPGG